MVKNTATLATLLTLGGLAHGENVQGVQSNMSENNQAVEVQANVAAYDENIEKQQQQPNCYYNYMEFDSNGECGENRRECFQVAGARYSLYPLKEKASMDGFLDGGKGGIIINQYVISDENAFAMTSGGRDLQQAIDQFQAKMNGKQVKTLDDVKACLQEEQNNGKGQIVRKWADSLGLSAALEVKKAVEDVNTANRSEAVLVHETTHWQDNDILSGMQTGKLMVMPEHYYTLKMVSEMKSRMMEAKASGQTAAQGLQKFEEESLNEYRMQFTQSAKEKMSNPLKRRQLALAMDDKGLQKSKQTLYPDDFIYVPNFSVKDSWVQMATYSTPEQKYCVYIRPDDVPQDMAQFTDKFDKVHPFNVLLDENKEPVLDKNGKMIAVDPLKIEGQQEMAIQMDCMQNSFGDETMKINYRLALRKMLASLAEEDKNLLMEKLNSKEYRPYEALDMGVYMDNTNVASLRQEVLLDGMSKEECFKMAHEGSVARQEQTYIKQSDDKAKSYVLMSENGQDNNKTMSSQAFLRQAQAFYQGR